MLIACVALVGCASAGKQEVRARPVDDPTERSLTYLVKAPFAQAPAVATKVLGYQYSLSAARTGKTSYGTPYWHRDTQYLEYEQDGKKYRSKCSVHIFPFKEYPSYIELHVTCDVDSYSFGFGRGGIHNLLNDLWWDWYPEEGIYLTQEFTEAIVRGLGANDEDVIRLRRFHTYEQQVQMIRQRVN